MKDEEIIKELYPRDFRFWNGKEFQIRADVLKLMKKARQDERRKVRTHKIPKMLLDNESKAVMIGAFDNKEKL